MKKNITSFYSLKTLLDRLQDNFIADLLAVVWKVVAAVHCFFQQRDHASNRR